MAWSCPLQNTKRSWSVQLFPFTERLLEETPSQFPQLPASCLYLHLSDKIIILLGVCTDKQGVKHYISCYSTPTVLEKRASNCSGERKTIAINALLNSYIVTMPLTEYSILISLLRIPDKNFSSNPLWSLVDELPNLIIKCTCFFLLYGRIPGSLNWMSALKF